MIINNVKLVLDDEVVHGSLEVHDGRILAFAESQSRLPQALDGEGGWLLPGLIELHTDNLDKFFTPRPKVDWPAHSAMSSHDAMMVASGITTSSAEMRGITRRNWLTQPMVVLRTSSTLRGVAVTRSTHSSPWRIWIWPLSGR